MVANLVYWAVDGGTYWLWNFLALMVAMALISINGYFLRKWMNNEGMEGKLY